MFSGSRGSSPLPPVAPLDSGATGSSSPSAFDKRKSRRDSRVLLGQRGVTDNYRYQRQVLKKPHQGRKIKIGPDVSHAVKIQDDWGIREEPRPGGDLFAQIALDIVELAAQEAYYGEGKSRSP